jgi:SAM-dependent methyltransferase
MNLSASLNGFLEFERRAFGDQFPVASYDPYLIRYGEYQYVLERLPFQPGDLVVDLGSDANLLLFYMAHLGARVVGIDLNARLEKPIQDRRAQVERATGRRLDLTFRLEDATHLSSFAPNSVDKVTAVSAIEHMFAKQGRGDQLVLEAIGRVLKPGGLAAITLPTSNGGPFHEAPSGDKRYHLPYRLYTPQAIEERILSRPELETVDVSYLAHTTPDPRYPQLHFFQFWMNLPPKERWKWAWANPLLAALFNPILSRAEGEQRLETVNTALICLRKKA